MGNTKRARARRYAERTWREGYWYAPRLRTHGTWNGYNNWYCHCPPCTQANTDRTNQRRANEKEGVAAATR